MSLIQKNINGRNKSSGVQNTSVMVHKHRMRLSGFCFTELLIWCRQRHYNDGLQYAWQEYRLEPDMRPTVVAGVLEEGAGEKEKKRLEGY